MKLARKLKSAWERELRRIESDRAQFVENTLNRFIDLESKDRSADKRLGEANLSLVAQQRRIEVLEQQVRFLQNAQPKGIPHPAPSLLHKDAVRKGITCECSAWALPSFLLMKTKDPDFVLVFSCPYCGKRTELTP